MSRPVLPAKVMAPGEARQYLEPFLLAGELYITDALAQSMDIAKRFGIQGAGEGRMFVTNARIIHWVEGTEEPWLFLEHRDVQRVTQTDDSVPRFALANGMTQLLIFTSTVQGRLQFLANARLARQLAADFSTSPPEGSRKEEFRKPPQKDPRSDPPQSGWSHRLTLPSVGKYDRIPSRPASLKNLRVVDPPTFLSSIPVLGSIERATAELLASPEHDRLMDKLSDPVISEYRALVEAGELPACDPSSISIAVGLGIAIAMLEKEAGWSDPTSIHPLVHVGLAAAGDALSEGYGPATNLLVDAAFNLARGTAEPGALFSL
jgi:hypothetical protein